MADEKEHLNLVFIGHVDHGKSTTIGRLLFDSGNIPDQTMRQLEEKADEKGKSGFEFAFVMDNLKEEQDRGVTIDLAHKKFSTDKYDFTIIDAPGHRDFVKNMITGASQADAAVLVCAANDGVNEQTKEHVFLAKTYGVEQLVCAVNKMDISGVDYEEDAYNDVKDEVTDLLEMYGYDLDNVEFVPTAALEGDNVVDESDNMDWYDGPTLLELVEEFEPTEKPVDLSLRMPIQDVYNITGIGVVPVGKIETGKMKVGQDVAATPGREAEPVTGTVKTIEMHHSEYEEAGPGDNVGVSIRGFGKKDVARGDVIGPQDDIPPIVDEFEAQVVVMKHPSVITQGYTPVVHVHTDQVACQFAKLDKKLDASSGEVLEEEPDFLKNGDAAVVTLKPLQPMSLETQDKNPKLSRFSIRDSGTTVAAGRCLDLSEKE
jgi:elongation factor 1-alpha